MWQMPGVEQTMLDCVWDLEELLNLIYVDQ